MAIVPSSIFKRACWTPCRRSLKPDPPRPDFVNLVDVDDATLSNLDVAFGNLDQP